MVDQDKRRHPRVGTHNLVSFLCLDAEGQTVGGGMGRTLNVSQGGILLETHTPLYHFSSLSLTIAMEDEIMEIQGSVAYSKKCDESKYETGIKFIEEDEEKIRFLRQFIAIFKGEI